MQNETLHRVLLSIHLFGVFIMLMGIGLLMVTIIGLRRAKTVEDLRSALFGGRWVERLMPIGTLLVMFAGIWMAFLKNDEYTWHSGWIVTTFILVIAFSINGAANIGKKMERLAKQAFKSPGGPLSPKLGAMSRDPALHYSSWAAIGVIFSFIVLMADKPNWLGSILWVIGGGLLGLLVNWLLGRTPAEPEPPAARLKKTAV
jgi:predicted lysophospholipase L1 biosynthesis ABC-type transport system permease subunit